MAVIAESVLLKDIETGEVSKHCHYFKMKALETHRAKEINDVIIASKALHSVVFTVKSTSYFDMES